jgi:sortase A
MVGVWSHRLLLAVGLALLAVYAAARIESYVESRKALKEFEALTIPAPVVRPGNVPELRHTSPTLPEPEVDFRSWDGHRVRAYKESAQQQSILPIAVLRISKIGLAAPLFEGTDDLTLNHGLGWITGTARPDEAGNVGIAGHRDSFFRGLKDVHAGDQIELQTLDGSRTYVIDRIQIVLPSDVSVLKPRPAPSLTLVTCYPFYFIGSAPQRYIVTASLRGETNGGAAHSDAPSANSNLQSIKERP